jgi:sodium/potassium/calcium exchanger 6
MLASTAERFLCPALSQISDKLKMSESLSISFETLTILFYLFIALTNYGVTLLALGNGAPDVFASLSAAGSTSSQGFNLAVSSLLGSGLFISCIVSAMISISTRQAITVTSQFFTRDIIFYLVSACLLLYALVIE